MYLYTILSYIRYSLLLKIKKIRKIKNYASIDEQQSKGVNLELNLATILCRRKMGLPLLQSCVMRIVRLTIRKKWCWEGIHLEALHVSVWGDGSKETMNMKPLRIEELQIRDAMGMLEQLLFPYQERRCTYKRLLPSVKTALSVWIFQFACKIS